MSEGVSRQKPPRFWDGCLRVMRLFPVLIVVSVKMWSYYAYVLLFCMSTVETTSERVAYLSVFHFLFLLLWTTYFRTVFTRAGVVPESFRIPEAHYDSSCTVSINEHFEEFSQNMGVKTRTATGEIRYCEKCQLLKPDRTHHCSACRRCVLKMDHHCPWINNCVGFYNYKFFMLLLIYSVLYCIFIGATTLTYCIKFSRQQMLNSIKVHIYIMFLIAALCLITITPLLVYHCYLISENRSTVEAYRAPVFPHGVEKSGFNLGIKKNFVEVFGENFVLWFLPVTTTPGDGIHFPLRIETARRWYDAVGGNENCLKRWNNDHYGEVKFNLNSCDTPHDR